MEYKKFNDYELINFINDNNEEANEIIYEKYKPLIISKAKKMFSCCQNSGIELNDLIQEGMLALNYAIETFDDTKETTFYTYALTCIERKLVSEVIKTKRLKHRFLNESISFETQVTEETSLENILGDNSYNPEKILINYEKNKELINNIRKKLTDFEKQVFDLKINNFNYKEIAEILEKNSKAIDNAIQRIKQKVKEYLN